MKLSRIKKILVPTDFSPEAINAANFATQLARKVNAEIILLYVLEYPGGSAFNTMMAEYEDPSTNVYVQEVLKDVKEIFDKNVRAKDFTGLKVIKKILVGNPFDSIAAEVISAKADLVVMGTKGTGGISGNLIGSNTEKVVRRSACPVISIHENINLNKVKTIVFPTRFEKESTPVVNFLKIFNEIVGAKIRMVFVNTPAYFQTERTIKKHAAEYIKKNKLEGFRFDIYNELTEQKGILAFSGDIKADMIAMGTHGRKGVAHLFNGSIAEELVNHSKKPILTIRVNNSTKPK